MLTVHFDHHAVECHHSAAGFLSALLFCPVSILRKCHLLLLQLCQMTSLSVHVEGIEGVFELWGLHICPSCRGWGHLHSHRYCVAVASRGVCQITGVSRTSSRHKQDVLLITHLQHGTDSYQSERKERFTHPWQPARLIGWNSVWVGQCDISAMTSCQGRL